MSDEVIKAVTFEQAVRDLVTAGTAVVEAGFVCSPELWSRLNSALADVRAVLPIPGMPDHNELLAAGGQYLDDGVYAIDEGIMIRLIGNAYSRENVIFLEPGTYNALRRFAQERGYEPKPPERTR